MHTYLQASIVTMHKQKLSDFIVWLLSGHYRMPIWIGIIVGQSCIVPEGGGGDGKGRDKYTVLLTSATVMIHNGARHILVPRLYSNAFSNM